MNERFFFQDYLFRDMPVDEQEFPDVEIETITELPDKGEHMIISFDTLLRMNRKEEWDKLLKKVENHDVYIQDDVPMSNPEMEPYKKFYLGAYFFTFSKYCKKVYVAQQI